MRPCGFVDSYFCLIISHNAYIPTSARSACVLGHRLGSTLPDRGRERRKALEVLHLPHALQISGSELEVLNLLWRGRRRLGNALMHACIRRAQPEYAKLQVR